MESDNLKSIWKTVPTEQKSIVVLTQMLKESNHPVLKAIKKQVIFELVAFSFFLFCYYTMFDGAEKPLYINLILVLAIAVNMYHHLKGYQLQQYFRAGKNLNEDLKTFVARLQSYQVETIISKIVFIAGLATFFVYGIEFTEKKWWAIACILIVFIGQLIWLNSIWSKRINKIKLTIKEFGRN